MKQLLQLINLIAEDIRRISNKIVKIPDIGSTTALLDPVVHPFASLTVKVYEPDGTEKLYEDAKVIVVPPT